MKKITKRFLIVIGGTILFISLFAFATNRTYLFKALVFNFADVDDYKIFTNEPVSVNKVQPWPQSGNYGKTQMPLELNNLLSGINSIAVVVIKNDSLLFEKYWGDYSDSSLSSSFSVAKSITSLLIGVALKEGKIKSLDEPVGNYLPEFKEGIKAKLKIVDLLTMSSGSD
ncbi:MAG: serine hydrolase, partial [Sphingobacteriales bacterium]